MNILFLLLLAVTTECTLWRQGNIRDMRMLRECFHHDHAEQIAYLFPGASRERDRREAKALDFLARLLQSGTTFCDAYDQMTTSALHLIEHELALSTRNGESHAKTHWEHTLRQFKQRKEETQPGCRIVERQMSTQEKERYVGILSPLNKCISRVQLSAAKSLIKDQYRDEEQAFL